MYSAAKGQGVFRLIVKQQHYVLWARRTQCQLWKFRNFFFFFPQDFVIEACGVNKQQPLPKVTLMTGEKKRTTRTFWTAYGCYSVNTPVRK